MGQYYYVVNVTKKQYLHPHKFGEGIKLLEFSQSAGGTMTALAALLADGNGRGGGDIGSSDPLVGSWAGDTIVIAGDYADEGKFLSDEDIAAWKEKAADDEDMGEGTPNLHHYASVFYEDISGRMLAALAGHIR